MTRIQKLIVLIALVAALGTAAWHYNLFSYITPDNLRGFSNDHRILGPTVFMVVYILAIILMLPIIPFAVVAGAVFGLMPAFAYVSLGAIIGAAIAFYIARHFGKGVVEKIARGKLTRMHEYDRKIEQNGFQTVLLIRLIPLLPFKTPNYILGFTKVRQRDYLIATAIGILPESFVFAYVGSSFSSLSPARIFLALLLVGTLCVAGYLIGILLRKKRRKRTTVLE